MLPKAVRDKIEKRFGDKITSKLCTAVAEDIFQKTRQMVGETSVQRWFGFTGDHASVKQRRTTLDIIANYVGYETYELLSKDIENDIDISEFAEIDNIESVNLSEGTQIRLTYQPGRMLLLTYLGQTIFIVNESVRSKLQQGDKVKITNMAVGFELLVADVERGGKELGPYQAAKVGGLTSIEVILN